MKFHCPCCGYKTLDEEPPDTFEIYGICFWEDDGYQYKYPDETSAVLIMFHLEKHKKILLNLGLVTEKA